MIFLIPKIILLISFITIKPQKKLKNNIVDTISLLKDNPYLGPKMSDRFDIDTPFRYLIVSKQLVFYNVNEENIEIIRILDSRQDYLSLLF